MKRIVLQHVLSRKRSENLWSASLRVFEITCSTRSSSLMTRDFCVGLVYSDEQASIWSFCARSDSDNGRNQTATFFPQQLQFTCFALKLSRLENSDVSIISHTWERYCCFLIPITSRGIFFVVYRHDLLRQDWVNCTSFLQNSKNFRIFFRRVQMRWHDLKFTKFPNSNKTMFEQYSNNIFRILFEYCSNFFWIFCFITVGEFCQFWITVLHAFQILFYCCLDRSKNIVFMFACRSRCKGLSATCAVERSKRKSMISIIACLRDYV